ncbi:hypothetical protein SAV14893_009520 [Streptomyces avermitilis]|uniref:Uncharacterized protein n=1 Tax=Streptomyces avermitilis TaxID=33903 RepID=A0A4D4LUS8_STRAX|nr:hypothetical protein [Streptomyces sp. SID5469]BBJ49535.1 hypothetical protein SAVMC3_21640 [Streptomyces avermitilis]GDY61559.1 hypothetical protein SAV14893_009520 [Streptomyces avermitilis]GDY78339.1 hypothetical protein SAV31267_078240 [Streptomyces avermitilis]GDY87191.1 hypothetical protein SAVCW2_63900 [Streptomyces avermitilis]
MRQRLLAGLDDPPLLAPEERRLLLAQSVERSFPEAADRAFALRPDRQGIGWAARSTADGQTRSSLR